MNIEHQVSLSNWGVFVEILDPIYMKVYGKDQYGYGIYSLGRFATWRQILMDDVVKDVKVIEQLIEQRDNYSRRLKIV